MTSVWTPPPSNARASMRESPLLRSDGPAPPSWPPSDALAEVEGPPPPLRSDSGSDDVPASRSTSTSLALSAMDDERSRPPN